MLLSTQDIDKSQVKYRRRTLSFSADGRHARLSVYHAVVLDDQFIILLRMTVA